MGIYGKLGLVVHDLPIKTELTQKKGGILRGIIEEIEGPNSFANRTSKLRYDHRILKKIHLKASMRPRTKLRHPMIENQSYAN